MEETFCYMYADLCLKIRSTWATESERQSQLNADDEVDAKASATLSQIFREKLLGRCQQEFEVDRAKSLEEIQQVSHSIS